MRPWRLLPALPRAIVIVVSSVKIAGDSSTERPISAHTGSSNSAHFAMERSKTLRPKAQAFAGVLLL